MFTGIQFGYRKESRVADAPRRQGADGGVRSAVHGEWQASRAPALAYAWRRAQRWRGGCDGGRGCGGRGRGGGRGGDSAGVAGVTAGAGAAGVAAGAGAAGVAAGAWTRALVRREWERAAGTGGHTRGERDGGGRGNGGGTAGVARERWRGSGRGGRSGERERLILQEWRRRGGRSRERGRERWRGAGRSWCGGWCARGQWCAGCGRLALAGVTAGPGSWHYVAAAVRVSAGGWCSGNGGGPEHRRRRLRGGGRGAGAEGVTAGAGAAAVAAGARRLWRLVRRKWRRAWAWVLAPTLAWWAWRRVRRACGRAGGVGWHRRAWRWRACAGGWRIRMAGVTVASMAGMAEMHVENDGVVPRYHPSTERLWIGGSALLKTCTGDGVNDGIEYRRTAATRAGFKRRGDESS
ncbi:hypothetical protein GGX14DRAFT_407860 [Mycena pura]|uniref:Uncharacterized protein n=1 Tax=Mycena pura TaxID=153505 RepID=A0AAD6UUJ8_9AGAR|nr:hypothetical protein GGX14DRAFT_407860 [Mycena pura]